MVSIPFEQGNVFRPLTMRDLATSTVSQSLSIRAMSFDTTVKIDIRPKFVSIPFDQGNVFRQSTKKQFDKSILCLNPFRSGQCLSTAAVCWRQESCGLSDLLPNFFGRLRSWLLIWANNKQFAFFSFLNQSKVRSILPLFLIFSSIIMSSLLAKLSK